MFEFILRRTILKKLSKEAQEMTMLQKDWLWTTYISEVMISALWLLPAIFSVLSMIFDCILDFSLVYLIVCGAIIGSYVSIVLYFKKMFRDNIEIFKASVVANMYFSRYVIKGNAISKDDFEIIKRKNEGLYEQIMTLGVQGECYRVCFALLECLKKGTIQFVAIPNIDEDVSSNSRVQNISEKCIPNRYTMHALYVNNGWCYDTYSARQHPLEEAMKRFQAKSYTSFTYDDIQSKDFEDFWYEQYPALREWCRRSDCYFE